MTRPIRAAASEAAARRGAHSSHRGAPSRHRRVSSNSCSAPERFWHKNVAPHVGCERAAELPAAKSAPSRIRTGDLSLERAASWASRRWGRPALTVTDGPAAAGADAAASRAMGATGGPEMKKSHSRCVNGSRPGSGEWIRTTDLRVMSPTSYHCSTPRRVAHPVYAVRWQDATPAATERSWHRPIFPGLDDPSIVGAGAFHGRVRHGNGWDHSALATRTIRSPRE